MEILSPGKGLSSITTLPLRAYVVQSIATAILKTRKLKHEIFKTSFFKANNYNQGYSQTSTHNVCFHCYSLRKVKHWNVLQHQINPPIYPPFYSPRVIIHLLTSFVLQHQTLYLSTRDSDVNGTNIVFAFREVTSRRYYLEELGKLGIGQPFQASW